MIARFGVWTPWATIWCLACDYKHEDERKANGTHIERRPNHRRVADPAAERDFAEDTDIAICEDCRAACAIGRDDVALLQRIGFRLAEIDWDGPFGWHLEQTGGMCCALVVETGEREIVVTAMDGPVIVGEYAMVGEDDERWMDPIRTEELPAEVEPVCTTVLAWIKTAA